MPLGTEKAALMGTGIAYEEDYGQNGPGYSHDGGQALATGYWFNSCGHGMTWSGHWDREVCPTNPAPETWDGNAGYYYMTLPNSTTTIQWAYSSNGSSWTDITSVNADLRANECGTGYANTYLDNSSEVFAQYWRVSGSRTCKYDHSMGIWIKWAP